MKRIYFSAATPKFPLKSIKKELANKGTLLLLTGILLVGMVCGVLSAKCADESVLSKLEFLFASNFELREGQTMLTIFAASLTSVFLFLLAGVLMGLSVWGSIFTPVLPFFRGFGLGVSSGFLYASYSWKGVLFHLAVMLPGMVLSSIAVILSAREGMRFSKELTSASFSFGKGRGASPAWKDYLIKNGIILTIGAVAALFDMLLTTLLAGIIAL